MRWCVVTRLLLLVTGPITCVDVCMCWQIADLRKHLMRLCDLAGSRREEIDSTLSRLTQFQNSLQSTTENIDNLVDTVARTLSQPIADDVQAIQRDQQLFEVCGTNIYRTYLLCYKADNWSKRRKAKVIPSSVHSRPTSSQEVKTSVQLFFTDWTQGITLLSQWSRLMIKQ